MDSLTRDGLRALMRETAGPCVSLYMPTHRMGPEVQQDRILLRNLLGRSEKNLTVQGLGTSEVKALLEPAESLLQDGLFWRHQSDGLAIFLSSEESRHYRLPLNFEDVVVVTDHFHIKPLLPLFSGDGRFYILALSQNEIRLLQGTRHNVSAIELEGTPTSLGEALRDDDPEKRLQFHTSTRTPGSKGDRPAVFHGHGVGVDNSKTNILRYFYHVDRGVRDLLLDEQAPIVLAGVDYLLPIYQEANTYPYLADKGIEGNPEELSAEELHRRAWAIVQPNFLKAQQEAAAKYRQFTGAESELASNELEKVVSAAYHGRIETLFVAVYLQLWGSFDPDTDAVSLSVEPRIGDEDLLDFAAIQTLMNGGVVYAVELRKMPGDGPLAAVFRY